MWNWIRNTEHLDDEELLTFMAGVGGGILMSTLASLLLAKGEIFSALMPLNVLKVLAVSIGGMAIGYGFGANGPKDRLDGDERKVSLLLVGVGLLVAAGSYFLVRDWVVHAIALHGAVAGGYASGYRDYLEEALANVRPTDISTD